MADIQIKYANKTADHHEHITHVGNDSGTWRVSDVVAWIESGAYTFYTLENGRRAEIVVRQGATRKYLQTHADGYWKNNLLALPPCRIAAA